MRFLREDFPRAVRALEGLHGLGRTKNPNNESLTRPDAFQYNFDHLSGHLMALSANPEIPDPETGLPQAVHVGWRALALLEVYLRENGEA